MPSQYHLAFITPDFPPVITGGCGVSCSLVVNQLRSLGHQVDVYCFKKKQDKITTKNGTNFYFKGVPKSPFLNNVFALFHLRNKLDDYDIVHVYNMGLIPAAAILKHNNYQLVATINNPKGAVTHTYIGKIPLPQKINNFLSTNLIKLYKGQVDSYIALTEALKKLYTSNGYDPAKITVIPNMYDPAFLKPPDYQKSNKDRITLLYSGQLGDNKGILDLVHAFAGMVENYPNLRLRIVGKGKHQDRIMRLIKKDNLQDRVTLTHKPYPDVREEYFNADILVHPAKWFEPFSRVWLEAMCAGLFIVSSDNPGAKEILKENVIFYNPQDNRALVEAITQAVNS